MDIYNVDIVSIWTDSLVTNNQFFVPTLPISHNRNVCICNVQFGFVFQEEIEVFRILFMKFNQKYTHFALMLVC